jgi:sugar lactone lactonase YvrE
MTAGSALNGGIDIVRGSIVKKPYLVAGLGALALIATGSAIARSADGPLTQEAQFDHQVTGVAVTADGRRFVNFPRWTDDAPISVAEVMKDGSLRPYPDARWNEWRNARANELSVAEHFVCVQSIVPDGHGNLWVLDPGAPGNEKILPGAPKLVKVDLATDKVTKIIPLPGDVALQGSYLNDIRFSPDGRIGYITDSGTRGAIIVVDLESSKSWRALDGHPSAQVDKSVTVTLDGKPLRRPDGRQPMFSADGIAISNDGRTLFYQALTGKTLYSIDTQLLRQEVAEGTREAGVKTVAQTHVADGLWMSKAGVLYLTSPSDYSIKRLNGSTTETVLTDRRLRWPDTFAEGPDGRMYVTASHIQDTQWFTPGAPPSIKTQLFSFAPVR